MKRFFARPKGQVMVLTSLAIVGLLGAIGLYTDVGVMYMNWLRLQKAVDSAALAGANYLPEDRVKTDSAARSYAQNNGIAANEITSVICIDPSAGSSYACSDTAHQPANFTPSQVAVAATRTQAYYFGRVVGLESQLISVTATAQVPLSISCLNCASLGPTSQPPGGTSNPPVTQCSSVGQCQLVPIGLDVNTAYKYGQLLTLNQGRVGAGNWDFLSMGGNGANIVGADIANGFSGMVSVNDYFDTKPGQNVGPVKAGFQSRMDRAAAIDPNGTFASHIQNNPRVIVVPMVDWSTAPNGRASMQILGFAHIWLDSNPSSSTFTAYFINDVVPDSLYSTKASYTYHGASGAPLLIR